jgi:peptidase M28-like protein
VSDYRSLLRELAVPRLVGSPGHARVREVLKRELTARGYVVLEHQFAMRRTAGPAALIPVGGALAAAAIGTVWLVAMSPARAAIACWLVAAALCLSALLFVRGRGATPVVGVNLVGVRPRARVTLWLAAHYDSKGQPLSMALRIGAVVLAALGVAGLLGIAAVRLAGHPWSGPAEVLLAAPALIGGLLLLGNRVTNGSPGAVDNASALATVLAILDLLPVGAPVGVLFPDAEEYGLLGARALVQDRANLFDGTAVLNLDGIDDRGSAICFIHRPGPVVAAVATALGARRRRFLPVVVDGLAFGRVARECATIMRGDWRTACLVHTPLDGAERLTLEGSGAVADGVARVFARLLPS